METSVVTGSQSEMNRALICRIAGLTGLNLLSRAIFANRVLILSYHGVCGEKPDIADPDGFHVPAALFERQMELLKRSYRPVSLIQVREYFLAGANLPRASVLVTFDDGYRNVARHALPVLKRMKIPCVLFPVAGPGVTGEGVWGSVLGRGGGARPAFSRV